MISRVEGWMVSPRKSRRKSACFSRTTTSTPARASKKPSIIPAGPPPTMQQSVLVSFINNLADGWLERYASRAVLAHDAGAWFKGLEISEERVYLTANGRGVTGAPVGLLCGLSVTGSAEVFAASRHFRIACSGFGGTPLPILCCFR